MLPPVCGDCFLAQEVAKREGIVVATSLREVSPPSTGFETAISGLETQRVVHKAQKEQKTLKRVHLQEVVFAAPSGGRTPSPQTGGAQHSGDCLLAQEGAKKEGIVVATSLL